MKPPALPQRSELSRTLWLFRREFLVCVIFTMVVNILMLTPTLYMLQVFDRVMLSQSELTLVVLTAVMAFFFAVMAFAEWSRSRLLVRTGVKLDEQLNSRLFNASFEAYLNSAGVNAAQPFSDLTNLRQFLTGQGLFAFLDAPWTPIYIAVLFMLHPWLGWISIIFSLLLVAFAYFSHRVTAQPLLRAMESSGQVTNYLYSKLKNSEVIEAMGMLGDLRRRWQTRHQQHLLQHHRAHDLADRVQVASKFLTYTQQSLALGAGALLVIEGELSPGAMIAANVLMGRASAPIVLMVATWRSFFSARTSYDRLEALLAEYPERDAGFVHAPPRGHMRIENLVATVPGRAAPILKGLSADFPAGEVVAIVGPSGSGKSTLARSLVGIWPHVEGRVLIDGEPVQGWNRDELGPFLGYLPQDIELFDGTIAENIARFGEIEPDKVILAAGRAGVHEMVLRLPRGYDTSMGEAGSQLSGGQRQRIGLARAMYGDPNVIVLDEPNSNLDDVGEAALVAAVKDLRKQGKTVFLITHRAITIDTADRILVLHDGAILRYGLARDVVAAMQPRTATAVQGAAGGSAPPAAQPV